MPTVLVTGVYGFIGSMFTKLAIEKGWNVVGVGRDTSQRNKKRLDGVIDSDNLKIIHKDLAKDDLSEIMVGCDYVANFAAKTFVDHSIRSPGPFIQSNIVGTYNVLEQARLTPGLKKFIQISTDEVYGQILEGSYKEDAPLNPRNPYAATKAAADGLAISYFNTYKLPIIITRTENNYGPFQGPEKAMPVFVKAAMEGGAIPVYGDGGHSRMWLHVTDHCSAVFGLLENGTPGNIYHVAGDQELTNLQLAETIISLVHNEDATIKFVPDHNIRPGHDRRYALDSTKIREEIGWMPQVSLCRGLTDSVDWYLNAFRNGDM